MGETDDVGTGDAIRYKVQLMPNEKKYRLLDLRGAEETVFVLNNETSYLKTTEDKYMKPKIKQDGVWPSDRQTASAVQVTGSLHH